MAIDLKNVDECEEMKTLKKELTRFRNRSLKFVANAKTEEDALKRARILTEKLAKSDFFKAGGRQCPPGTVWDPATQTCV